MNKILMIVCAAVSVCAVADQLTLVEARAKIDEAVAEPAKVQSVVGQLSAADQKQYLADVNEAISKMPGSKEEKAARYLAVARAAVKGARKTDLAGMLATVYATVPPEALTVVNESFAQDLFNRTSDPSVTYTDEVYVNLAKTTLATIAEATAKADNGAVRTAFAVMMFVRGSNGSPANLTELLAEALPAESREVATKEWLPAALASGEAKSYEPILAAVDAEAVDAKVVLRIAGAQAMDALMADLATGKLTGDFASAGNITMFGADRSGMGSQLDNGLDRVPFYYDRRVFGTKAGMQGNERQVANGPTFGPDGKPIAPGGVPVGPDGRPVGPGRRPIEPGGYPDQDQ